MKSIVQNGSLLTLYVINGQKQGKVFKTITSNGQLGMLASYLSLVNETDENLTLGGAIQNEEDLDV